MTKVFISYRRSDTHMAAGRLRDSLAARLPSGAIFRDKDSIAGGSDWTRAIEESLAGEDVVVLALIGSTWLSATDASGKRRLDDPEDWNRRELEHALAGQHKVIPVLVDDAAMPTAAELPDALRPLAKANAVKLRDDDWETDVDKLARLVGAPAPVAAAAPPPAPRSRAPLVAGALAALVLAVGGWFYASGGAVSKSLSGEWIVTHVGDEDGIKQVGTLLLNQSGEKLTGSLAWGRQPARDIANGSVSGARVEFEAPGPRGVRRVYQGELTDDGNSLRGEAKGGAANQASWTASRQSRSGG